MLQGPDTVFTLNVNEPSLGNPVVQVTNRNVRDPRGNSWISGLQFDVRLDAADLDEAVKRSRPVCEHLSIMLSALTSTGLPSPRLELAMDVDSKAQEHPFLQILSPEFRDSSRRWMHLPHLVKFLDAIEKFSRHEQKPLLFRSLGFYRRALQLADPLEHFVMLFFALETLNDPLALRHGVSLKTEWGGVRAHFTRLKNGTQEFEQCRRLRNSFVHGEVDVGRMGAEAIQLAPKLRGALVDAYADLLSFTPEPLMTGAPMRLDEGLQFQILSAFSSISGRILAEPEEPPRYDAVFEDLHVDLPADHHSQVKGKIRLRNIAAGRVVFKRPQLRVIGAELKEAQGTLELEG